MLLDLLTALREDSRDRLESVADPLETGRLQGRAALLSELIRDLGQAHQVVTQRYS